MSVSAAVQTPRDAPRDANGRWLEGPSWKAPAWQKGQTGNPSGKSGLYTQVQSLCRQSSPESVAEIIRLRDTSNDDRVRFMAASWLYERAWGKVKEYDPSKDEAAPIAFDPSKLDPKQLIAVKKAMMVLLQATVGQDGEQYGAAAKPGE